MPSDQCFDPRKAWEYHDIRAQPSITIFAKGRMPLREAVRALKGVSVTAQRLIAHEDPIPSYVIECGGKGFKVSFVGLP
jgi:hypothetical protein